MRDIDFKILGSVAFIKRFCVVIIVILLLIFVKQPVRNNLNAKREYIDFINVVDSTNSGFQVFYSTIDPVNEEQFKEIKSRKHIKNQFKKIQEEIPLKFNNDLLNVDIYEFSNLLKEYTVDKDVIIQQINIYGVNKIRLYEQPNPNIENSATWINPVSLQGIQYITEEDIYRDQTKNTTKIYRYWKCNHPYDVSFIDEQFIHFSEDERI